MQNNLNNKTLNCSEIVTGNRFKNVKSFGFINKYKYPILVDSNDKPLKFTWSQAKELMIDGYFAYRKVKGYGWALYKIDKNEKLQESNAYSGWLEIDDILEHDYKDWLIANPFNFEEG